MIFDQRKVSNAKRKADNFPSSPVPPHHDLSKLAMANIFRS